MNISHIDVYLHLHQRLTVNNGSSFPGNELASSTLVQCGENGKFATIAGLGKDISESRNFFFDRCFPPTAPQQQVFQKTEDLVNKVVEGYNVAVITLGLGKLSKYNRSSLITAMLEYLDQKTKNLAGVLVSYAFLGITDSKCINLLDDRTVQSSIIKQNGLEPVLKQVESVEEIGKKVRQGSSLPFILSVRLEKSGENPFISNFLMADLGNHQFHQFSPINDSTQSRLTKSFAVLQNIVKLISQGGYTGVVPFDDSVLTSILAEYMGGAAKTALFIDMENQSSLEASSVTAAFEFTEALRKIKCREVRNPIDRRVAYYESKYEHYRKGYYDLQEEINTRNKIMQEKESAFAKTLKDKEKELCELQEEKIAILTDIEHLKMHANKWERECASLQTHCKRLEAISQIDVATEKKQILDLKEALRKLGIQLSIITDDRDEAELEVKKLKSEHAVLQSDAASLEAQLQKIKKSFDIERKNSEKKDIEIEQLKVHLKKKDDNIDGLRETIKKKEAEIREAMDGAISEKIKQSAQIISQTEKLNKAWDVERGNLVEQIDSLKMQLTAKGKSAEATAAIEAEKAKLETKVAKLKEKLKEAVEFASNSQLEFAEERGHWQAERESILKTTSTNNVTQKPVATAKKSMPKKAKKQSNENGGDSEIDTISKTKSRSAKRANIQPEASKSAGLKPVEDDNMKPPTKKRRSDSTKNPTINPPTKLITDQSLSTSRNLSPNSESTSISSTTNSLQAGALIGSPKTDKSEPLRERTQDNNVITSSLTNVNGCGDGLDPMKKKRKLIGKRIFGLESLTDLARFNILPQVSANDTQSISSISFEGH